jgi:hypothetical protein
VYDRTVTEVKLSKSCEYDNAFPMGTYREPGYCEKCIRFMFLFILPQNTEYVTHGRNIWVCYDFREKRILTRHQ